MIFTLKAFEDRLKSLEIRQTSLWSRGLYLGSVGFRTSITTRFSHIKIKGLVPIPNPLYDIHSQNFQKKLLRFWCFDLNVFKIKTPQFFSQRLFFFFFFYLSEAGKKVISSGIWLSHRMTFVGMHKYVACNT